MAKGPGWASLCIFLTNALGCTGSSREKAVLHTVYGAFDPLQETLPVLKNSQQTVAGGSALRVVQFSEPVTASTRATVAATVGRVRGYFPDNALLVEASDGAVNKLLQQAAVRSVIDLPVLLKVDPRLVRATRDGARLAALADGAEVLLELAEATSAPSVAAAVRSLGGHVSASPGPFGKILRATVGGAGALTALAALPEVAFVAPRFAPRLLNDRSYGVVQAGERHLAPIWAHGLWGAGQMVAVADSGVDAHTCFFPHEKVAFYEDRTDVHDHDGDGHGTHVAGTIAGDNFGNGTYDINDGMAPAAQLYVQDVADGSDLVGISDDLRELFAPAYDFGARIHSNSWGDDDNSYSPIDRTVDDFVYAHRDFLAVFAAGNSGSYASTVGAPATAKNVLAVGAVHGSAPNDMAYFSSHGPTADGRLKPTLVAPGVSVVSARRNTVCGTSSKSGTSMATPTVAGATALAREYFTDGFYPTGVANLTNRFNPSAALLKAVLMAGADDMDGVDTGGHVPSNGQGFGRIHLANSLRFAKDPVRLVVRDEGLGLETGESHTLTVQHRHDGPLKAALTWTDPPGLPGAKRILVNDLDLVVQGPSGTFKGNMVHSGVSRDQPMGSDTVNVEEIVYLPKAAAGAYTLSVLGANVPLGPQTYGLAIVLD